MSFVIHHADALIPITAGAVFLGAGFRRWLSARPSRRLLVAGAVLTSVGVLAFAQPFGTRAAPPQTWVPVSEAGQFSLLIPAEHTYSEFDEATPHGPARTHKWIADVDDKRVCYIFRYTDLPAGARYEEPDELFDALTKAAGGFPGSRVTGTSPLSRRGFPGRRIEAVRGGIEMLQHVFVTPKRMYSLIRTSAKGASPVDDVFFSSFTLESDRH